MTTKADLEIKIGSYTFPSPIRGTYQVVKTKWLGFAERAGKKMRIDQLGDVWQLEFELPSLPQSEYKKISEALDPFVVSVSYFNEWTGKRQVDEFYHTDLVLVRISLKLHAPLKLKFIGTETIE